MSTSIRQPAIWKTLQLSGGDKIIVSARYADDGSSLSLPDINHNVYRLNPAGEVVWQVRRDDSNRPPDWWEQLHRLAREQGQDGAREPFMYIQLEKPDGTRITSDRNGDGTNVEMWSPGSVIWLVGSAYQEYILDPDTGIAKNVTPVPLHERPW
jgi:hypothetical protein